MGEPFATGFALFVIVISAAASFATAEIMFVALLVVAV